MYEGNFEVCSNFVVLLIILYFSSYFYSIFIENKLIFKNNNNKLLFSVLFLKLLGINCFLILKCGLLIC